MNLDYLNLPEPLFIEHVSTEFKNSMKTDRQNERKHSEVVRAKWALFINKDSAEPRKILRAYGVSDEIIKHLTGDEPLVFEKKPRIKEKYSEIIEWCKENHLAQTTVKKISDVGSVSYPTALKFMNDRPDLFYKIKRGLYEVRNPQVVRQEEKMLMEKTL